MKPPALKLKVLEPFLVIRQNRLDDVRIEDFDIRVRVKGGGYTSQLYGNETFQHQQFVCSGCNFFLSQQIPSPNFF